jgi:integrase
VDMKAGMVTFPATKNGDSRTVPMTNTLRDLFSGLARPLDRQSLVLPQWDPRALTVAFGRLVRSLGLANLRFHDLRHDAASTLTMAGVPQRTIMALLGHRDPRMTLRYQHLSPEQFRDAVRALDRPSRSHTMAEQREPMDYEVSNGTISAPVPGGRA